MSSVTTHSNIQRVHLAQGQCFVRGEAMQRTIEEKVMKVAQRDGGIRKCEVGSSGRAVVIPDCPASHRSVTLSFRTVQSSFPTVQLSFLSVQSSFRTVQSPFRTVQLSFRSVW